MYTTVKSLHVALDVKIQQIASNRKKSILPQQMDMILNDAVNEYLETRLSNKMNILRKGIDDEILRYDGLSELKREYHSKLYVDETYKGKRMYTLLPSDYRHYLMSESISMVNKGKIFPPAIEKYYTLAFMDLYELRLDGETLAIEINNDTVGRYDNVYQNTKSKSGSFYCFNTIVDKYRSFGLQCYLHDWKTRKYHESMIYITDFVLYDIGLDNEMPDMFKTRVFTHEDCARFNYQSEKVKIYPEGSTVGVNELMPSENLLDNMHNHYGGKNRYLQPMVEMQNRMIYVYYDDYFIPTDIKITYIKQPRMINIDTETMCELSVNDEILEIAAQKALSYLGIGQQRTT
jgi:hypothetical protein